MTRQPDRLFRLLAQVKKLAREYRALTGRPLGVTGEVAEYEAARLLGLRLCDPRQAGHDAIRRSGRARRLQIKGRCLLPDGKPGQRMGAIKLDKPWDAALLVLLDEHLDTTAIYEAPRAAIAAALRAPGSRARNERGALGVNKFKSIGRRVWPIGSRGHRAR